MIRLIKGQGMCTAVRISLHHSTAAMVLPTVLRTCVVRLACLLWIMGILLTGRSIVADAAICAEGEFAKTIISLQDCTVPRSIRVFVCSLS